MITTAQGETHSRCPSSQGCSRGGRRLVPSQCPAHPCQHQEGPGGARPWLTQPSLARTSLGQSKTCLLAVAARRGSELSAWDRQQCPRQVPCTDPRVSRLRCSPCSARSREPLGEQPDPPVLPRRTTPGGPSGWQHLLPTVGSLSRRHPATERRQPAQAGSRCSIPAPGWRWSRWGHPARTVPAHSPPSTPPEIAWLPPPGRCLLPAPAAHG